MTETSINIGLLLLCLYILIVCGCAGYLTYMFKSTNTKTTVAEVRHKQAIKQAVKRYTHNNDAASTMSAEDASKPPETMADKLIDTVGPVLAPEALKYMLEEGNDLLESILRESEEATETLVAEGVEKKIAEEIVEEVAVHATEEAGEMLVVEAATAEAGPIGWIVDAVLAVGILTDLSQETNFTMVLDPSLLDNLVAVERKTRKKIMLKVLNAKAIKSMGGEENLNVIFPRSKDVSWIKLFKNYIKKYPLANYLKGKSSAPTKPSSKQKTKDKHTDNALTQAKHFIYQNKIDNKTFIRDIVITWSVAAILVLVGLAIWYFVSS